MSNLTRKLLVLSAAFFLSALLPQNVVKSQEVAELEYLPIDVMQVLELPAHFTNPTLLRSKSGYLLKGQISSSSDDQILGFSYQLLVLDGAGKVQMGTSGTTALSLGRYATEELSLPLSGKLKINKGDSVLLAVEQVVERELVWEVVNARKSLEAYGRGDYLATEIRKALNLIDSKPRPAVIY